MKKILLLIIIYFLASVHVFADDWDLFQKGVKHYRSNEYGPIEGYTLDTVNSVSGNSFFAFNSNFSDNGLPTCENINNLPAQTFLNSIREVPFYLDSIYKRNDTTFCPSLGIPFFLTRTQPGSSWMFHGGAVTITCDSFSVMIFHGLTDSVKHFTAHALDTTSELNGRVYVLSKNFGLIEFSPSDRLVGIETVNGVSYGAGGLSFNDVFHLNDGDILFWRSIFEPYNIQDTVVEKFFLDTITNAIHTVDSVVYHINRTTYSRYGNILNRYSLTKTFLRNEFDKVFSNSDRTPVYTNGLLDPLTPDMLREWYSNLQDISFYSPYEKIQTVFAENFGYYIDLADCSREQVFDAYESFTFDTVAGLIEYRSISFSEYTETLRGYKINGITKGSIKADIPESGQDQLAVYPNPVMRGSLLNFQSEYELIKIYDLDARLLNTFKNVRMIQMPDVAGSYFVACETSNAVHRSMVIVY